MSMEKALSVRAPWWWWILYGGKIIENRSRRTHYRGPILIHASTWWRTGEAWEADRIAMKMYFQAGGTSSKIASTLGIHERIAYMDALSGHIVGRAEIVDCREPERWRENPWHMAGQYGWELAGVQAFENPYKVKGALGLFNAPAPQE